MGHFGDKFRNAREKKELTLDQVSNVTKISSRMLKAIEEEHFDQLPGGVFNKGFIRAYAKHLGLNDEEAVNDYLTCLREAQVDAHEVWEPQAVPASPSPAPKRRNPETSKAAPKPPASKPQPPVQVEELPDLQLPRAEDLRPPRRDFSSDPSGTPWGLVAVAAVVVVLAIILWARHSRTTHPATAMASTQAAITQPAPSTTPAPVPPKANPAPSSVHSTPSPVSPPVSPSSTQPHSAPQPSPSPSAPTIDAEESADVTVRNFDKTAPKSSDQASATLTLVIRASENSWISVLADGQLVTQETLIAPANTSIHASREITVRIGNAAGVTFLFNGQEVPAQGDESEVKIVTFDASGFKSAASQSPPEN